VSPLRRPTLHTLSSRISGQGSDAETIKKEREYEEAVQKGLRPCKHVQTSSTSTPVKLIVNTGPTCKKYMDLGSNAVFKAFAFEATEEEVRQAVREHRRQRRERKRKGKGKEPAKCVLERTSPARVMDDYMLDDSDEEMPDFKDILAGKSTMKLKATIQSDEESEADEVADVNIEVSSRCRPAAHAVVEADVPLLR
jgi:hypothetical protein